MRRDNAMSHGVPITANHNLESLTPVHIHEASHTATPHHTRAEPLETQARGPQVTHGGVQEVTLWPPKSRRTTTARRRESKLITPPEDRLLRCRSPEFGGFKEGTAQPAHNLLSQGRGIV